MRPVGLIWPIVREQVVMGELVWGVAHNPAELLVRPVGVMWPGELLFSTLQGSNLIPRLRTLGAPLTKPDTSKRGTQSFRGDAARALSSAKRALAQLLRAG